MTATSHHFKDIVPSPAQNWNQMVPAVSIEESHENRNAFIGVLSLGKILATVTNGSLEQIRPCRNVPRSRSNSGTKWNYLEPLESHDAEPPRNQYPSPVPRGLNPKGKPH